MSLRFTDLPPHIHLAFDISALGVPRFTGVANVVARLLEHFRSACAERLHAFSSAVLVSDAIVGRVLERNSGDALMGRNDRRSVFSLVGAHPHQTFLGLFGSAKSVQGLFPFEAQIIYDLTVILTPECHDIRAIDHHMRALEPDMRSNDLSICISNATRDDLISYLDVQPRSAVVAWPGVDPPCLTEAQLESLDERYQVKPYFIVLGTIEPRKNIPLIFKMLCEHSECVDGLLAVFVGQHGWGPTFQQLVAKAGVADLVRKGRIRYLGYASELEKEILLRKAEFCIYPSFYEGFGLPVLEALRLGCPVVSSFSSSLPEAGGNAAYYFDPFDAGSLAAAITRVRAELAVDAMSVRERGQAHALRFGWERFCTAVEAAICNAAVAKLGLT